MERSARRARRGQGIAGYVTLVALLAIAGIAVLSLFGGNLGRLFGTSNDTVGTRTGEPTAKDTRMMKKAGTSPTSEY
jgi:hypothetical protein